MLLGGEESQQPVDAIIGGLQVLVGRHEAAMRAQPTAEKCHSIVLRAFLRGAAPAPSKGRS